MRGSAPACAAHEPRSGGATGAHQIVVNFSVPVTIGGVVVSNGTATIGSVSGSGFWGEFKRRGLGRRIRMTDGGIYCA